ncbi:MAG: Rieske 2Fe-2S domain-containing protein [Gemmatimonas sp.]|nr:Rieske 2Fe-2S domain-containing protein [Gemmatimonas sp.]
MGSRTPELERSESQASVETAWNLPPEWFTSPEIFALEKEHIFRRSWNLVGRTDQIAEVGDRFSFTLHDEPVLVVRASEDKVRAFANVCRHRSHRVDVECKASRTIRCPYHGWAYELNGQLRKAKGMDGAEGFDVADFRLHEFHCETLGPWIFVALEDPPPFQDVFAPVIAASENHFAADLEYRGTRKWEAPINWKAFTDNFDESYHLPYIHSYSLEQVIDWQDEWKDKWGLGYYGLEPYPRGPGARMAGAIGGVGDYRRLKPAIPTLTEKQQVGYTIFWVWPLTIIFFMPDGMIAVSLRPTGPETLEDTWSWWMPPAADSKEKLLQGILMHFGHIINEEDTEAMIHVQEGLRSRYAEAGRYAPNLEDTLHHSHKILRSHLLPLLSTNGHAGGNGNGSR